MTWGVYDTNKGHKYGAYHLRDNAVTRAIVKTCETKQPHIIMNNETGEMALIELEPQGRGDK
jgi:hypothetical protein